MCWGTTAAVWSSLKIIFKLFLKLNFESIEIELAGRGGGSSQTSNYFLIDRIDGTQPLSRYAGGLALQSLILLKAPLLNLWRPEIWNSSQPWLSVFPGSSTPCPWIFTQCPRSWKGGLGWVKRDMSWRLAVKVPFGIFMSRPTDDLTGIPGTARPPCSSI